MDTIMQLGPPGSQRAGQRFPATFFYTVLKELACQHEVGHTLFSVSNGGVEWEAESD